MPNKPNASRIELVDMRELADLLGFSSWTIDGWVRVGKFPRPFVAMPGSPRRWRVTDVEAWIEKRRHSRDQKPAPRGLLRGRVYASPSKPNGE